mgnify:CR=1 FL=1
MDRIRRKVFSTMLKHIDLKGKRVLEFGCGVGRWVPFILSLGALYIGVDISENMIKIAKSRFSFVRFYKLNSCILPFPDNYFDFVFSITVLHHNPFDVQDILSGELIRVTKPFGYIFLLEGIVKEGCKQVWFNTYARSVKEWNISFRRKGKVRLVKIKYVRYWLLRDLARKLLRGVKAKKSKGTLLETFIVKIDGLLDYYLLHLMPKDKAVAAAMLFQKLA